MATYEAVIVVKTEDVTNIKKVFAAEDKELSNNRGSYSLEEKNGELHITAKADDAVAFRAVNSAVSKILAIYEKMKQV